MPHFPSENSLVVNGTHQMLTRIHDPYDRTTAIAPTRYQESQSGGGYDVELPLALRIQFQYKAPKRETKRGVVFRLDQEQITTLATREPSETAYYACPIVDSDNQLNHVLENCFFIDAQAIQAESSQLTIPRPRAPTSSSVQGKIKDRDDQSGFEADPDNYYEIPHSAVYTWDEISRRIESRNLGMVIQEHSTPTTQYDGFLDRLQDLWLLHDDAGADRTRTDGGAPHNSDEERIDRLVSFAKRQFEQIYEGSNIRRPDVEGHEQSLRSTLKDYDDVSRPDIHGIRRAQEVIAEKGSPDGQSRLQLGYLG